MSNWLPVARIRAYRSRWLWVPAVAISLTAQAAMLGGYVLTRPTPKPMLTIRLLDGASEWDYAGIETTAADRTSLTVATGEQEKVEIATAGGTYVAAPGQQVLLPNKKQHVNVTITARDGSVWTRGIELDPKKQAVLTATYTPSRGQVLVTRAGESAPFLRCSTPRCVVSLEPGSQVQLSALVNEGSTFAGFKQYPMRTPSPLVPYLGDPLADCKPDLDGKKSIR